MKHPRSALLAVCISAVMTVSGLPLPAATAADKDAAAYTYTVTPLLAPFNEYFFVKTDNPDPYSFRFADPDSVYSEDAGIVFCESVYEDIAYEDAETLRVGGGYLFKSFNTDGGTLILQKDIQTEPPYEIEVFNISTGESHTEIRRNPIWEDTAITAELEPLCDDVDYLVKTYATDADFFGNMDAIQSGFSSICLYSGSYIRGNIYRANEFWSLSNSPHIDQTLYIQSPYRRQDNRSLFATALYPYRYDSLGFPGMMSSVAAKLDSTAEVRWNSDSHYLIDVTYDGETKSYGGAGSGDGQGISAEQISHPFTFGEDDTAHTLEEIRALLLEYAALEMPDDVPDEDTLTWSAVCDTVGEGAWVRLISIRSVFGGQGGAYAYLWKGDDRNYFYDSDVGAGGKLYWSGSLGYGSDIWIDGRYLDRHESYIPGAVFADHPESDILLPDIPVPQFDYQRVYNYDTQAYEYQDLIVTEQMQTVRFSYDTEKQLWLANTDSYRLTENLAETGQIEPKYLDALQLTAEEVAALQVDRNTDIEPEHYFLYDGTAAAGTEVFMGDINQDGTFDQHDTALLMQWLLSESDTELANWHAGDFNHDLRLNAVDLTLMQQSLLR